MADGPACKSRSSLAQGASSPAEPAGTEMPPIDHWSMERPQAAPLGLQTRVSLVLVGTVGAEPVSVPATLVTGGTERDAPAKPVIGGTEPGGVAPTPGALGAELLSVPPAPKYSRVGIALINGYVDVSLNWDVALALRRGRALEASRRRSRLVRREAVAQTEGVS
jgi:hypothetical protein